MSDIGILKTEIKSFLDNTGFTQYQKELEKSKEATKGFNHILKDTFKMGGINEITKGMKGTFSDMFNFKKAFGGVLSNPFTQLIGGYFTLTGAVGQYKKMVEASNKQFALETSLSTSLKSQGYLDEQIEGLKTYMGELQNLGVIGDEASMVAVKTMASFKVKEDSIRKLLPQVHNLMLAEKGLNATEGDAEKWSKAVGIALQSGQLRGLKQAGIILDEHTQKIFENANEQQRASILYKELTERIGDQNAEFLKTPEGKIINAQNRIGDTYEQFGAILRETRSKFWGFMADNLDTLQPFISKIIKGLASGFDTGINTVKFLFKTFANMPQGAKNAIKLITGFFMLKKFPIMAGILVIEDILGAFQGKDSVIEDVFNEMTKFFNSDYKFADLRKGVWDFWDLFIKGADSGIEKISLTTKILSDLLDILKGGIGFFQMLWGATAGVLIDTGRIFVGDFENVGKSSFGNIKGGFTKIMNAGQNMNKTADMYDNYLYDMELEKLKKEIAQMNEISKYEIENKSLTIPTIKNSLNKKDMSDFINSFNSQKKNIKEEGKLITSEEIKQTNNSNITINSKPTLNLTIENTSGNPEEIKKIVTNVFEEVNKKQLEVLKVGYGGQFALGGAY